MKQITLENFDHCTSEAIATIEDFWFENLETDLKPEEIQEIVISIQRKIWNISDSDIEKVKVKEINATPLHTCLYDIEDGIPEKAYNGVIIIVRDPSSNKTLIIDGNHRFNTLKTHDPDQELFMIEIEGTLP